MDAKNEMRSSSSPGYRRTLILTIQADAALGLRGLPRFATFLASPGSHQAVLVETSSSSHNRIIRDESLALEAEKQRLSEEDRPTTDSHNPAEPSEAVSPVALNETQYLALPYRQCRTDVKGTGPQLCVELPQGV